MHRLLPPTHNRESLPRIADMHNAATLLNLVQLSVAVASSVSTVAELTAAVGNISVDKILVAAGTYDFTSDMCGTSAVCINRALTIKAQVPGSVVFGAKGGRRVFEIQSGGTAELIGLDITGGYATVCLPFETACDISSKPR